MLTLGSEVTGRVQCDDPWSGKVRLEDADIIRGLVSEVRVKRGAGGTGLAMAMALRLEHGRTCLDGRKCAIQQHGSGEELTARRWESRPGCDEDEHKVAVWWLVKMNMELSAENSAGSRHGVCTRRETWAAKVEANVTGSDSGRVATGARRPCRE
jgi:hypothetical protein